MAASVVREYIAIGHDLATGAHTVPDFSYALRRHRLLAAIEDASRLGVTINIE
ncbi:hypothetical protein [Cupriavidus pinatubonensis]|uniref:Uncharacterized protein n=1 Tax=Cupriavidus pinatubonensis TaxID=248026 RepID=A0ABM8XI89_9BURK|nr:hypothetical protein [Cupriavidus pinatubonensis]CAG9179854.1 hypothetical protein LMG23994_04272 [Cupriavidus pinatubonensis]